MLGGLMGASSTPPFPPPHSGSCDDGVRTHVRILAFTYVLICAYTHLHARKTITIDASRTPASPFRNDY
eukprot:6833483-Pyramimonas_sp.AAC.1